MNEVPSALKVIRTRTDLERAIIDMHGEAKRPSSTGHFPFVSVGDIVRRSKKLKDQTPVFYYDAVTRAVYYSTEAREPYELIVRRLHEQGIPDDRIQERRGRMRLAQEPQSLGISGKPLIGKRENGAKYQVALSSDPDPKATTDPNPAPLIGALNFLKKLGDPDIAFGIEDALPGTVYRGTDIDKPPTPLPPWQPHARRGRKGSQNL